MIIYLLAWFPMLLLAILNGIIREALLIKQMNIAKAHQVSTLTLLCLLGMYMVVFLRWSPPASAMQAVFIGSAWMFLTLLFEFGFGRYRGNSWQSMLAEYNLLEGKLWVLVPASILLIPLAYYYFASA
ncbi:MAG TPA: hypothetical protein VGN63_17470 [Flavisolibacter sp.]|nr:hypothetical protein [Flavisolibacter sp.]